MTAPTPDSYPDPVKFPRARAFLQLEDARQILDFNYEGRQPTLESSWWQVCDASLAVYGIPVKPKSYRLLATPRRRKAAQ